MSDCEDCKNCKCGKKKEPPTIERASMILYAFLYPKERKNLQGCTIDNGKLVVYLSKETEHEIPEEFLSYGTVTKVIGNVEQPTELI